MARLIFICMVLILLSLFSVTFIVPEIVNSFRSVSEITISVVHHTQVFTVLSILVLIFNSTGLTEVYRTLTLACTSHCTGQQENVIRKVKPLIFPSLVLLYFSSHNLLPRGNYAMPTVISN